MQQPDAAGSILWDWGVSQTSRAFVSRKLCLRITYFLVLDTQQVPKQRHIVGFAMVFSITHRCVSFIR